MTYNLAIQACSGQPGSKLRAAQLNQAFQILTHMRAAGVPPCAQTITTLFALCAKAGQGRRALDLYQVCTKSRAGSPCEQLRMTLCGQWSKGIVLQGPVVLCPAPSVSCCLPHRK